MTVGPLKHRLCKLLTIPHDQLQASCQFVGICGADSVLEQPGQPSCDMRLWLLAPSCQHVKAALQILHTVCMMSSLHMMGT